MSARKYLAAMLAISLLLLSACASGGNAVSTSGEPSAAQATNESIDNITDSAEDFDAAAFSDAEENMKITIEAGGESFSAVLYDSDAARDFAALLPLTLDMSELNGNEKYYYLDSSLQSAATRPDSIKTGDIMLFGSDCLVLFYKDFTTSYSYTPLGYISDADGLEAALGRSAVSVTFTQSE